MRHALLACLIVTAPVWMQARQTATNPQESRGELFGVVKDSSGGSLPGVRVTIAGPTLPQPQSTVTDSSGAYRFAQIPAGTYGVAFDMPGFFPLTRASVLIAGGAHVGLNVELAAKGPDERVLGPLSTKFKPGEVAVEITTPLGRIVIAVDAAHAPVTAANFLKYVDGHFYDGGRFHRATRPDNYTPAPPNRPMMELIQAAINSARNSERFPAIPLERTSVTGLKHMAGTVSMARSPAADTATSDFFILLDDQPSLDLGGMRFDDGQGAAAFGRVVEGLDVVRRIQQQPVQGQNLMPPVPIAKISRLVFL